MDFTSFFVYFLTQWVIRIFNSVKSISQTIKADSHHLSPDLDSGSQMSSETHTKTENAQEPVGHQYQTETSDPVLEEEITKLRQQLRTLTLSRDVLLVKTRQMKSHAISRMSKGHQQESKIVSLEGDVKALRESVSQWEHRCLTSEKELNLLRSAYADQVKLITELNQSISDFQLIPEAKNLPELVITQNQENFPKESLSLSRVYDRTFLLKMRTSLHSKKIPNGFPIEIVREGAVARKGFADAKRNLSPKCQSINVQVIQAPHREFNLAPVNKERPDANDSNVWRPTSVRDGQVTTETLLKTVRGLLNKMTPTKHDKIFAQIQALDINDEERLSGVISLFFEKAISEPFFASTYAKMCQALSEKTVLSSTDAVKSVSFRTLLLAHCKKEFDKDSAALVGLTEKRNEIFHAETEERKKQLKIELQDLVDQNRRKALGNITLIGELFRVGTISEKVIHRCIHRLLIDPAEEKSIELLCSLMSVIGKELDTNTNSELMNFYFCTLERIAVQPKLTNRTRFMVIDLTELRSRKWTPRHESLLEEKQPSCLKTQLVSGLQVNSTEETNTQQLPAPTTIVENPLGASSVHENTSVFQYSDYRLRNKSVSGYNVIPTTAGKFKEQKFEILDPIPAQEPTVSEPISTPASFQENSTDGNHHFAVVASSVRVIELKKVIVLKNVDPANCGRIIGREGSNLKRLSEKYGIFVQYKTTNDGNCNFSFSGSSAESRREAVDEVIECCLTVTIEFDYSKIDSINRTLVKQIAHSNFVHINFPKLPEEKITMCGKLNNCENTFFKLLNFK
jgi:translation initiation factor 4G